MTHRRTDTVTDGTQSTPTPMATHVDCQTVIPPPVSSRPSSPQLSRITFCLLALSVIVLSFSLYANSLHGDWTYDDVFAIVENGDVTGPSPVSLVFSNDFWGADIRSDTSHKSYRPITVLSFRLNYILAGNSLSNTFYFHVVNVALHTSCSVALLVICDRILWCSSITTIVTTFLFTVHPIHTEAVASVVGRAEPLSLLCSFVAMGCFFTSIHSTSYTYFLLSLFFLLLAVLSKEISILFPFVLITYDVLYSPRVDERVARRSAGLVLFVIMFLLFRISLTNGSPLVSIIRNAENPVLFLPSSLLRCVNISYIHGFYLALLVAPWPLSADYGYACIPLLTTVWDSRHIVSLVTYVVVAVTIGVGYRMYRTRASDDDVATRMGRVILLSVAWIVLSFFPASNVLFWVGTLIAERLLYSPSVGWCILMGVVVQTLLSSVEASLGKRLRSFVLCVIVVVIVCILVLFCYLVILRNADWANDTVLFQAAAKVCPNSVKVIFNLAMLARQHHDWSRALSLLTEARTIDSTFCVTDHYVGVTYLNMYSDELQTERRTVQLSSYLERGKRYMRRSLRCRWTKVNSAVVLQLMFEQWKTLEPNNALLYQEWASMLLAVGSPSAAALAYVHAAIVLLTNDKVKDGVTRYQRASDVVNAIKHLDTAASLDKASCAEFYLAMAYNETANTAQSEATLLSFLSPSQRHLRQKLEQEIADAIFKSRRYLYRACLACPGSVRIIQDRLVVDDPSLFGVQEKRIACESSITSMHDELGRAEMTESLQTAQRFYEYARVMDQVHNANLAVRAYTHAALQYAAVGNRTMATRSCKRGLRLNPQNCRLWYLLGNVWLDQGRLHGMVHAYGRAFALSRVGKSVSNPVICDDAALIQEQIALVTKTLSEQLPASHIYQNLLTLFRRHQLTLGERGYDASYLLDTSDDDDHHPVTALTSNHQHQDL